MKNFLKKVLEVQSGLSVTAFARKLGMNQKTVDLYVKGERKPSVDFVRSICSTFSVSADWLLGLQDRSIPPQVTAGNGAAVSIGSGTATAANCRDCPILLDFIRRRSGEG